MQTAAPNITPATPSTKINTLQQRRSCDKYSKAYVAHMIKKLKGLLLYTFTFSLIIAFISQLRIGFIRSSDIKPQCMKTIVFGFVLFISNLILLFTRFAYAKLWKITPPSAAAEFVYAFTLKSNWLLFVFYSCSSWFSIHWYFSHILNVGYTNTFYQQPPGHFSGANQLSLENIFILLFSIALAAVFTVDFVYRERSLVKINNVQQSTFQDVKTSIATIVSNALHTSSKTFLVCYFLFIFTKSMIYYMFAYVTGTFSRVLDSPVIGFHWFNLYLFFQLMIAGTLTLTSWNIAHRLFDVIFPEVIAITDPFANQYDCLIDGLSTSNKDLVRCAAYAELSALACKRREKRMELFSYIKSDIKESAWHRIMLECISVIQELEADIDVEYNGPKPAVQPVPVTKPNEPIITNRIQLVQNNDIYVTPKKYEPYLDDRTGILFNHASQLAYEHVPSPYPTVEKLVDQTRKNLMESQIIKLIKHIELKTNSTHCQSMYANTVTRRVQLVFRKYQLVIYAIQSLGSLTAASLTEDQMGYVQYNIGTVLDTLLGLLALIEKYTQHPPPQYQKLTFGDRVVLEEPNAIIRAIQEAVYQIVGSFSEYTDGFSVQAKYQKKWQSFLDYKE